MNSRFNLADLICAGIVGVGVGMAVTGLFIYLTSE